MPETKTKPAKAKPSTAVVTITEDGVGEVTVKSKFDPPLTKATTRHVAAHLAMVAVKAIQADCRSGDDD